MLDEEFVFHKWSGEQVFHYSQVDLVGEYNQRILFIYLLNNYYLFTIIINMHVCVLCNINKCNSLIIIMHHFDCLESYAKKRGGSFQLKLGIRKG